MARYYNKTRTPVSLTLRSGKAVSIPGKRWLVLEAEDEGSSSLAFHVSKGHLVRQEISTGALPEQPVPVPAPVAGNSSVAVQNKSPEVEPPSVQSPPMKKEESAASSDPQAPSEVEDPKAGVEEEGKIERGFRAGRKEGRISR